VALLQAAHEGVCKWGKEGTEGWVQSSGGLAGRFCATGGQVLLCNAKEGVWHTPMRQS
jgi:hypothetical protein